MKKISCDIIKDVLPLYLDGVVSNATKEMVEEHLSSCDSCRKEAELLKQDIILPTTKNIQLSEARVFKKMKSHLRKKNVIILISTMIATILLIIGLHSYAVLTKNFIPYDDEIISISEIDGKLYATYQGDNLGGTVSCAPETVTINGSKKKITIFYYYKTPWSEYIQPIFEKDDFEDTFLLGKTDEIDQIYYGEFKLDGPEQDTASIAGNSELIWGD
jgi:hypothetical protein